MGKFEFRKHGILLDIEGVQVTVPATVEYAKRLEDAGEKMRAFGAQLKEEKEVEKGIDFMHWVAATEKETASATLGKRLWDAADQFRANSGLKAQEYSGPILGLIFLRFAELRFTKRYTELEKTNASSRRGSRIDEPAA